MQKLVRLTIAAPFLLLAVHSNEPVAAPMPIAVRQALAAISADELKGNLSFLASDALQGRYTPSPGLDVAAEFIASKFRAAGLEPGGEHDYFQEAEMVDRRLPNLEKSLTVYVGDRKVRVPAADIALKASGQARRFDHIPVVILPEADANQLKGLDLKGKAVLVPDSDWDQSSGEERSVGFRKLRAFERAVASSGAAAAITIVRHKQMASPARLLFMDEAAAERTPALSIRSDELAKLVATLTREKMTLTAEIPGPNDTKAAVKNVIGILRGSDPVLSKTAVLLTAHYDHIGTVETAGPMSMHSSLNSADRIYNGANDDGSGTVSVIEVARALANIQPRPKRSIVFMAFFGEERGELGSQFYGKHPVFPVAKTVADLNLEQLGRTDSTNGLQTNNASVTGFDYSDVTGFLERAGARLGVRVYQDTDASDEYFTRSDNEALAEQGVPAHTIAVAFDFPDYHGVGDEWQKIDYENMAKVDRMVLLALFDIANSERAPNWNAQNPKTERFRNGRMSSVNGSQ